MAIKKFLSFQSKNEEPVSDLVRLLSEEYVHVELFHQVINSFIPAYAKKMTKAFDLMKEAGMIQIIEKDFTYKKLCKETSMLKETTETRQYYRLEEL